MSLAARISLLAACAVGLAVSVASLAAYVTIRDQLHTQMDTTLSRQAEDWSRVEHVGPWIVTRGGPILTAADVKLYLISSNGYVGPPVPESRFVQPISVAERQVAAGLRESSLRTLVHDGERYRAAANHISNSNEAVLLVQSTEPIESTLDRMGLVLLIVGGGGIVAAALIGLAVARSALMPVRRLSAAADTIARTEELTPIEVTGDDELASLATSFNKML